MSEQEPSTRVTEASPSESLEKHIRNSNSELVPSVLTVSLRELTDRFGNAIIGAKARATRGETQEAIINETYDLFTKERVGPAPIDWRYEQRTNTDGGIRNPLDEEGREELLGDIEERLPSYEDPVTGDIHPPDLAISRLVILLKDAEIAELVGSDTDIFRLTFRGDKLTARNENRLRESISQRNEGYLMNQGFKFTNLNLRRMVTQADYLGDDPATRYVEWGGPSENILPKVEHPRLSIQIANHLPTVYSALKQFDLAEDDTLTMTRAYVGGDW